jgi:hypothetical protein
MKPLYRHDVAWKLHIYVVKEQKESVSDRYGVVYTRKCKNRVRVAHAQNDAQN